MLKYAVRILVVVVLVGASTACANLRTLTQAREIDRQVRADRVDFLQRMSDAYRILAFEYYKLAVDAEKQKKPVQAKDYSERVALYDAFYKEARKSANDLRAQLQAPEGYELPTLPEDNSQSLAPASVGTSPGLAQPASPRQIAPSGARARSSKTRATQTIERAK